jgi:hypothetical protein
MIGLIGARDLFSGSIKETELFSYSTGVNMLSSGSSAIVAFPCLEEGYSMTFSI